MPQGVGSVATKHCPARASRGNEGGFAIVMFAVGALLLSLLIGFGVDLGSWLLRAQRIQRASDAAALAGSIDLPDSVAAKQTAIQTAIANGFVDGGDVTVSATTTTNTSLKVTITDRSVPTYFTRLVLSKISLTRVSTGQRNTPIPLGSPFNVFGGGTDDIEGVGKQGFWAAINGVCTSKEDGDYFTSRYDGNKQGGSSPTQTTCPTDPATALLPVEANPDFNPNGYNYLINVPSGQTDAVKIEIWDPQLNGSAPNGNTRRSLDPEANGQTLYRLLDTHGTVTRADDTLVTFPNCQPKTFDQGDARATAYELGWFPFCTIPADSSAPPGGRQFRLVVASENTLGVTPNGLTLGVNAYGVRAQPVGLPDSKGCDSRKSSQASWCPTVVGDGAISILNDLSATAPGGLASFFLAGIDPVYAGTEMTVSIFDPGEGVDSIQLLGVDGQPFPFTWETLPAGASGGTTTALPTNGTVGVVPGRSGDSTFNDKVVLLHAKIPKNYAKLVGNAPDRNTWWKLQYKLGPTATADRTTWGVQVGRNAPAHLVQ